MTDSNKTNDLDRYGVWVKKPPRTVDSENTHTDSSDSFSVTDITSELPDFSSLDNLDSVSPEENVSSFQDADTTLSVEELSGITGSAELVKDPLPPAEHINTDNKEDSMAKESDASSTEEIPLDEFITGGFSDDSSDNPSKQTADSHEQQVKAEDFIEPAPAAPAEVTQEETFSLDDFLDGSLGNEEPQPVEAAPSSDDKPLDIDLSFDESPAAAVSDEPVFEEPAAELSAVDTEPKKSEPLPETEEIDLSSFGMTDSEPEPAPASPSAAPAEEVDISEFGLSNDTEEAPAATTSASAEKVDYDMSVTTDDDSGEKQKQEAAPAAQEDSKPQPSFTAPEDSDFDIDAIMSDVKDENGKTVCIGKAEDTLVKEIESVPEEIINDAVSPEVIEDLNDTAAVSETSEPARDIPDTFEEETASLIDSAEEEQHSPATEAPAAETVSSVSSKILDQIVDELDSLKNEIAGLKIDFADLKKREESEFSHTAAPAATEDNGFFSNIGDDDTIALSGDELDNILNNADFTETAAEAEPVQKAEQPDSEPEPAAAEEIAASEPEPSEELPAEPATEQVSSDNDNIFGDADSSIDIPDQDFEASSNLRMDFSNDNLEEPSLEDIDLGISQNSDESSISKELPDEITVPKVDDILVDSSTTDLMDSVDDSSVPAGQPPVKDIEKLYEPDPSISETLTDDKIDYLSADKNGSEELVAEEIDPAEQIKAAPAENAVEEEVASESSKTVSQTTIPGDLKQEIKSVLSYMDQLLENLPEEKITEFAQSEQFETYKKLFKELGLS
jgi:hypothetical protein